MITVHVWQFRGKAEAWGHASMSVGSAYVSWWPESPGAVPSGIHPNIYKSSPYRNRSFRDDVRDEGQMPDHNVVLNGLDEQAIVRWWAGLGLVWEGRELAGPLQPWSTLDRNCSTVVAEGLRVGGGDRFSSWWDSWNLVWTPADVLRYATEIERGLRAPSGR